MSARLAALVVLDVLLLALPAHAADESGAPDSDVELAKAHFNTGQIDYDKGRFAEAAHEFEEAYRLSGRAPLLYNVGRSYDGANDYARALGAYRRFVAAGSVANDLAFAQKRIQLLSTLVGTIALARVVAGSTVTLDGAPAGKAPLDPLTVNPGRHDVELVREGYANFKASVDVPVGGAATLEARQIDLVQVVRVEPSRARRPLYKKWWLWTAVGGAVVVAGVVTAVVLTTGAATSGMTVQLPGVR